MTTEMKQSSTNREESIGEFSASRLGNSFALNQSQEKDIDILCQVAETNGDSLSLAALAELVSVPTRVLEQAWKGSKLLNSKYVLGGGLINYANHGEISREAILSDKVKKNQRAMRYIQLGEKFSSYFASDHNVRMMAVSGSTSYYTAAENDDLDFFCITRDDRLWIFVSKALLIARVFRMRNSSSPVLCFSYILGVSRATNIFSTQRTSLFARDAMSAIVLRGDEYYQRLLRSSDWIGDIYPAKYEKISLGNSGEQLEESADQERSSSAWIRILNLFLYATVGNYIRLKSYFLNRKYLKSRNGNRLFKARIDIDRQVFESSEYIELGRKYADYRSHGK